MAKPYISDEEAARIDAEAVRTGRPALRAPSESLWRRRLLDSLDTLSPAGPRVEDHLTPISDAMLHTGGRLRRGKYAEAFRGVLDAVTEVGVGHKVGEAHRRTDGPIRIRRTFLDTPFILGRDVPLDRAYKDFVDGGDGKPRGLNAPSMYALPYDKGFHAEGGYRGKGIDPAVSVAYMMNPEVFRAGPKSSTLWYGKDAATGTSRDLGVRVLKHLPNSAAEVATTEAVRKLLAENPDRFKKYVSSTEDPKTATERDAAHFIGALVNIMTGPGAGGSYIPATERTSLSSMRRKGDKSFVDAYPFLARSKSVKLLADAGITPRQLAEAYEYWSDAGVYDPDIKWFADNFATNPRDLEILHRRNFSRAVEAVSRSNRQGLSLDYKDADGKITSIPVAGAEEMDDPTLAGKMGDILGYVMMSRENGHPDTFAEAKSFSIIQPDKLSSAVPAAFLRINRPLNLVDPETVKMIESLEAQWDKIGVPHLRAYTPEYEKWSARDWSTVDPKLRPPEVNLDYKERPNPLQDDLGFRPTPEEAQIILGTRLAAKGGDTHADSNGGNSLKTLLRKVFPGSGAPPFATGRPQVRNSGIEREVYDAIVANSPWKWETYRWNPEAIGGQAVDPKNIKGTGVAFDEADRATLPDDRRAAFEAWMDELADPKSEWETDDGRTVKVSSRLVPKDWRTNKRYDRDYDFVRAFLLAEQDPELKRHMLGPVYHAEDGRYWLHINDAGKLPNHPTFSRGSYYAQDPKYADLAGDWKGEAYIPGKAERAVHQDAKGGDVGQETAVSETPVSEGGAPAPEGGPRIVINPTTFRNKKDALCVAFNEAFRVVMEDMQFDPVSEPTDRQRKFFSDTAYADDETQLRRTILARICTFDTSVKDPTDEQLQEAVEFLENVMEVGAPQNEWEQSAIQRIHDVIAQSVGRQPVEEPGPEAPSDEGTVEADIGGGDADSEDERRRRAIEFAEERGMDTTSMDEMPIEAAESVYKTHEESQQTQDAPQGTAQADVEKDPQVKAWREFAASYSRDQPTVDTEQAAPAEQPASEQDGFTVKSEKELSKMGVAERMDYNRQVRQATGMSAMQAAGSAGDGEGFAAKSEKELSKMGVAERMDYNRQVRQATGMSATQAARASVGAEEENPVHAKVPHHGAVLSKGMRRLRELTSRSQWELGENGDDFG